MLPGTAARTKKLRAERAADAHQQGRRPVPAHPVGARSAAHSGTVWCRLRPAALGLETSRTWRKKRKEAGHRGHGKKAGRVAASPVGKRRSVRAIAQPQPNDSCGSCVKTKSSRKRKNRKPKAEFR